MASKPYLPSNSIRVIPSESRRPSHAFPVIPSESPHSSHAIRVIPPSRIIRVTAPRRLLSKPLFPLFRLVLPVKQTRLSVAAARKSGHPSHAIRVAPSESYHPSRPSHSSAGLAGGAAGEADGVLCGPRRRRQGLHRLRRPPGPGLPKRSSFPNQKILASPLVSQPENTGVAGKSRSPPCGGSRPR